jgi:hypothetical protein
MKSGNKAALIPVKKKVRNETLPAGFLSLTILWDDLCGANHA